MMNSYKYLYNNSGTTNMKDKRINCYENHLDLHKDIPQHRCCWYKNLEVIFSSSVTVAVFWAAVFTLYFIYHYITGSNYLCEIQ